MKKSLSTKVITFICLIAIFITSIPSTTALAASPTHTYEVISEKAVLRSGPTNKDDVVITLSRGDFIPSYGIVKNRSGNYWYKVQYGNSILYCYEKHLAPHKHQYDSITLTTMSYCHCGAYITKATDMTYMNATTAGNLLSPEVVEAAAQLSAIAATTSQTIASTIPYVAIVVVGGLIIYMAISGTGTRIETAVQVTTDAEIQEFLNQTDPGKPYHKSYVIPNKKGIVLSKNGMDLNTANAYLRDTVKNPAYATFSALTKYSFLSVWCPNINYAEELCKRFSKNGTQFMYGSSTDYDCLYEIDKDAQENPKEDYFYHYHLWYQAWNNHYWKKADDAHIFFGLPYKKSRA